MLSNSLSMDLSSFIFISFLIFISQASGKNYPNISRVTNAEKVVKELCNKPVENIIIGTPNSGEFSYYGRFQVVNLDGLMNDIKYLNALKSARAVALLKSRGVDLVVTLNNYVDYKPYNQFTVLKSFEKNDHSFFILSDNCKIPQNQN